VSKPPQGRTEPFVRLIALAARERGTAGKINRPATRTGPHAADRATYEERAGALIKKASAPAGLDSEGLERLWTRLEGRATVRARRRMVGPVRWAMAAALLLVGAGVVAAKTGAWTWPRGVTPTLVGRPAVVRPEPPASHRRPLARRLAAKAPDVAPPTVAEPAGPPSVPNVPATPSLSDHGPSGRAAATVRHRVPAAVPVAAAQPPTPAGVPGSTLASESVLLGRALARLRVDRDAAGAIVELDRYSERFPTGTLRHEAQRARLDALLTLGRLADARTILASLNLGAGVRDRELRLIRAELTADGACAAALSDYEAVLADSSSGPFAARALWGRAACRTRLGDERGARADLAAYLDRFPAGAHAAAARARIGNESLKR
jgi:hypothetical protein